MDDAPPPEAFEPQPVEPTRSGLRRSLMAGVTVLVIVALIVLAFVGSGGTIGSRTGATAGEQPRLAFVDSQGRLRTATRDGAVGSTLGPAGVRFSFPAWSPDGDRIAAIGQATDGTGLYVFPANAAGDPASPAVEPVIPYRSPDRPPFYLYWAPDGRSVSFLTTEPDGIALRIVPADGASGDTVVRQGAPMYWDFVDAAHLLVNSGAGGPEPFYGEVGLDGAASPTTEPATGIFRAPDVSPDGRFRALLAAGDPPVGEVVREARDGSGATRIRVFGPAAMTFSPTGDGLAFIAPDQLANSASPLPLGPLRILDPTGAEPRTLVDGTVVGFVWSPNGKGIAALRLGQPDHQVTEAVARNAVARDAVAREVPAATGVALSLTFVGVFDGSVTPDRAVHVSDLFVNQVLPFFDQYALSHRFWTPDGASFLLPIVGDDDRTRLIAIPIDGSEPVTVAEGEFGSWSP